MSEWSMNKKKWRELTPKQRRTIVAVGAAQLTFIGAALTDLRRRPASQIRGSKRLWTPIVFLNFVGPIAYFLFGLKR